jgi:hypothetical protein
MIRCHNPNSPELLLLAMIRKILSIVVREKAVDASAPFRACLYLSISRLNNASRLGIGRMRTHGVQHQIEGNVPAVKDTCVQTRVEFFSSKVPLALASDAVSAKNFLFLLLPVQRVRI